MEGKEALVRTIDALNASIAAMSENHKKEVDGLNQRIKELTAQVAWLNRQLFGRKSERLAAFDPGQMDLFAEEKAGQLRQAEEARDEAGMTPDERRAMRQELSRPIMEALRVWMETEGVKYSESSLIGQAVTYAYTRWDNMTRYLDDGRLLIDNNLAENEIRPITLGRKNYLFCGNHEAAQYMAVVCSLLATCRNHDINPRDYLNDVIARMPYLTKATQEELVQLLPHK